MPERQPIPEPYIFTAPCQFLNTVAFSSVPVAIAFLDNALLNLGTSNDIALVLRASSLGANTALTGVIVGTPVTPAVAADSLIIGNKTADGDMLLAIQTGGNSHGVFFADASASTTQILAAGVVNFTAQGSTTPPLAPKGLRLGLTGTRFFGLGTAEAVTLVSNVATVTSPYVVLDAEGAGTTDQLDSITYTGQAAGDLLLLTVTATDTITADTSATLWLGAATRAIAPGGALLLYATSATIWKEVAFIAATSA